MKKLFVLLLALLSLFAVLLLASCDEQETTDAPPTEDEGGEDDETPTATGMQFKLIEDGSAYEISDFEDETAVNVVIPATYNGKPVTRIGKQAFWTCSKIETVTFEPGSELSSIGSCAFQYCSNLLSITLPASLTSIESHAFEYCYKLIEICNLSSLDITAGSEAHGYVGYRAKNIYSNTSGASKLFEDENGFVFYVDDSNRYLVDYRGNAPEFALPLDCNGESYEIYQCALWYLSDCTSLVIPSSVTRIGDEAFFWCENLESVTVSSSVTSIGEYAFYNCRKLAAVIFEEDSNLESIGDLAFSHCVSLESIAIPARVTSIGDGVFLYCSALSSVTFENPVGWFIATTPQATNGTDITPSDLENKSTAATYLVSTYCEYYYWKRG